MPELHHINESLSFDELEGIIRHKKQVALSENAIVRIQRCRAYLDEKIASGQNTFYGINTGFGALCNTVIPSDELEQLQENLLKSHACGTGEEVPLEIVQLMLLLKVQSLSYGHSGVQLSTVQRLLDLYNLGAYPVVYQLGSLGASGDLAPLSHLCLPLIGQGELYYQGKKYAAAELLAQLKLEPLHLQSKEGLALINGTQFMLAYGVHMLMESKRLLRQIDLVAACSLDAFSAKLEPFTEHIHLLRPHRGQVRAAAAMRELLAGSQLQQQEKIQVQDPYSFRCIPQVHGASYDAIAYTEGVFLTEMNAVTDNPNVFPEEDLIVSGGNFHGQSLALALDFLAIALAELASISERRTYLLISGQRGLPAFLAMNPGLHSGLMIAQYTAAAIVSQNKQLCSPASVDSIVSSNGQEDHVSMGANAATKCYRVLQNLERVIAIELLCAAQAMDFRRPLKSSAPVENYLSAYRKQVPFIASDRVLHDDIENSVRFLKTLHE